MTIESLAPRPGPPRAEADPAGAAALLRAAQAATYRFPPEFAGFTADVVVTTAAGSAPGTVAVRSATDVALVLEPGFAARKECQTWAARQLGSLVGHRWHHEWEDGDGRWEVSLEPDVGHPLGPVIRTLGDPFTSSYRVRDGQVTQVERTMGEVRLAIVIHRRGAAPGGRSLPEVFTVAHWHLADRRLVRADTFVDAYTPAGPVMLPASRRVVSADDQGLVVRTISLSDHRLLATTPPGAQEGQPAR